MGNRAAVALDDVVLVTRADVLAAPPSEPFQVTLVDDDGVRERWAAPVEWSLHRRRADAMRGARAERRLDGLVRQAVELREFAI